MSYGTFQTAAFDAALDRLDNTKPVRERDPFIGEGDHLLMVVEVQPFMHKTDGPSVRASFEVLASVCHAIGSRVTKIWKITKPSKFESQETDADKFADFVRKLLGGQQGEQVGPKIRALIRERVGDQLARGMIIGARGSNTSKKADKPWVEVYWTFAHQSQDEIKMRRAALDQKAPLMPQQAALPPAQPQYAPQTPNNPANYAQTQVPPQYMQQPPQYAPQPQVMQQPPQHIQQMPPQFAPPPQYQPQPAPAAQPTATPTQPPGLLGQLPGW